MRGLATFLVATLFLAVVAFLAVRLVAAPPPPCWCGKGFADETCAKKHECDDEK